MVPPLDRRLTLPQVQGPGRSVGFPADAGGLRVPLPDHRRFADGAVCRPRRCGLRPTGHGRTRSRWTRRSGYRLYDESQVRRARLWGNLRRLDMPLAVIADLLALDGAPPRHPPWTSLGHRRDPPPDNAGSSSPTSGPNSKETNPMRDVELRRIRDRTVLSITRHVTTSTTDTFFHDAFRRLRAAGPVSRASRCPLPGLLRRGQRRQRRPDRAVPARAHRGPRGRAGTPTPMCKRGPEPAHDEAYIRLGLKDMGWPAMLPPPTPGAKEGRPPSPAGAPFVRC